MKLEKAIETGQDLLTELPQSSPDERREAVKLLIKSGEREVYNRNHQPFFVFGILPGETED